MKITLSREEMEDALIKCIKDKMATVNLTPLVDSQYFSFEDDDGNEMEGVSIEFCMHYVEGEE
jgi:hypothetical protein